MLRSMVGGTDALHALHLEAVSRSCDRNMHTLLAIFEHESDARTVLAHAAKTPKRSASRGGERRAAKLPREM